MIRWLRVVLPPSVWLLVSGLASAVAVAMLLYCKRRWGVDVPQVRRIGFIFVGSGVVGYAFHRVYTFHPVFQPAYRDWLGTTPWTSQQALPLGPVHLVLQDGVIFGLYVLMAWPILDAWVPYLPQLFLAVYLICLGAALFLTGEWGYGYGVEFGVGLVFWLWQDIPLCLTAALATYGIAYMGLRRSLGRFPWGMSRVVDTTERLKTGKSDSLGWPFGRLGPKFVPDSLAIPGHHALLISGLAGWLVFTLASLHPDPQVRLAIPYYALLLASFVPILRLGIYLDGYAAPISLGGRLRTGRWLIAGYDQVFVAPLLAIWVVVSGITELIFLKWPFAAPVMVTLVLLISLGMGPSLKEWRLTGNHRIGEGAQKKDTVKVG